jgi:hypothetical protein
VDWEEVDEARLGRLATKMDLVDVLDRYRQGVLTASPRRRGP